MKCYIVCGPESAGNRLLAGLVGSCIGQKIDPLEYNEILPTSGDAVIIRSFPAGGKWLDLEEIVKDLRELNYEPVVLITNRAPHALVMSQLSQIRVGSRQEAYEHIQRAYRLIFKTLPEDVPYHLISYEAVTWGDNNRLIQDLKECGLEFSFKPLSIDRSPTTEIMDGNGKHY